MSHILIHVWELVKLVEIHNNNMYVEFEEGKRTKSPERLIQDFKKCGIL